MFVDLSLKHRIVKDVLEKAAKPALKRELVDYARKQLQVSLRVACRAVGISDQYTAIGQILTEMMRSLPNYRKQ